MYTIYFAKNAYRSLRFANFIKALEDYKWTHTYSLGEEGDVAIVKDNTGPKEGAKVIEAMRNQTPLTGTSTLTIVDPRRDYHGYIGQWHRNVDWRTNTCS